ncbi:hypothetical protein FN846DRAFT_1018493 [Sphaerosporella brunnea]|uniref:Uncharacterized protein n=1 Tax=Sphaerosporella brunnea TaxID=1250544 RepID=A0A5J5FA88_9PEZI|nr:hypothetical protein FN846DRAFT_1018493 [Sphaerosporella brunnea]
MCNILNPIAPSHRLTLTGAYQDAGVAQMDEYPLHKLLVKAMRPNGWHEMDTYFKPTLADNAPRKIMLRVLANETRVYEHYPGLYALNDGYMALYAFINRLLKASQQSKAEWLTSWPVAHASAPLDENVAFVLPKAIRRGPDEAALDNEDDNLAYIQDAHDDNGLADLLDAPPPQDVANQSVAAPIPEPPPQGMLQQILAAVNGARADVNTRTRILRPAINRMEAATDMLEEGATSLAAAKRTCQEAEGTIVEAAARVASLRGDEDDGVRAPTRSERRMCQTPRSIHVDD